MGLKNSLADVSVVVPTLNSLHLLSPVIDTLRETLAHVGEVIVVDSYSTDGTMEFLRDRLDLPGAGFYSHPKGLYASWNFGISKATREWIYIATAGDVIGINDLVYLHNIATQHEATVVCSPPVYVNVNGDSCEDPPWPIFDLLESHKERDIISLSGVQLAAFAIRYGRFSRGFKGWLGSSASNLYRAEALKSAPFSTQVGKSGDTLWGIENTTKSKAVFCRRRCGRFVIHPKNEFSDESDSNELLLRYGKACEAGIDSIVCEVSGDAEPSEVLNLIRDLHKGELSVLIALANEKARLAALKERSRETAAKLVQLKKYLAFVRKRIPQPLRSLVFPRFSDFEEVSTADE
jgi:hypothetical protein